MISSLFLKDLAQKTRRGLEGRVRKGKSAGGLTSGYNIQRGQHADGTAITAECAINTVETEMFSAYSVITAMVLAPAPLRWR